MHDRTDLTVLNTAKPKMRTFVLLSDTVRGCAISNSFTLYQYQHQLRIHWLDVMQGNCRKQLCSRSRLTRWLVLTTNHCLNQNKICKNILLSYQIGLLDRVRSQILKKFRARGVTYFFKVNNMIIIYDIETIFWASQESCHKTTPAINS